MRSHHSYARGKNPSNFYEEIGGQVQKNFGATNGVFKNPCALNMSFALNKCGIYIPKKDPFLSRAVRDSHSTPWEVMSGQPNPMDSEKNPEKKEKYWYIFRVRLIRRFLRLVLGEPTLDSFKEKPKMSTWMDSEVNDKSREAIGDKKGIIIYECKYSDATGHCDLWQNRCIEGVKFYLTPPKNQFVFWELS
jgi:hypothetical protein